jgi:hypothetical protein
MNETTITTTSSRVYKGFDWSLWTRAVVAPIGMFTNSINIWVFTSPRLKNTSYKYMLTCSISNLLYLTLAFLTTFASCDCPTSHNYMAVLYLFLFDSISASLAIFEIAAENILSLYTYYTLTNRVHLLTTKFAYKRMVVVLATASILFYLNRPFARTIISRNTIISSSNSLDDADDNNVENYDSTSTTEQLYYSEAYTNFGNSSLNKSISIVQTSIRLLLVVVVLTTLNVLNVIEFRKRFRRDNNVRVAVKTHASIAGIDVFSISLVNTYIGTTPYLI